MPVKMWCLSGFMRLFDSGSVFEMRRRFEQHRLNHAIKNTVLHDTIFKSNGPPYSFDSSLPPADPPTQQVDWG